MPTVHTDGLEPSARSAADGGGSLGESDRRMPRWIPRAIAVWYGAAFVAIAAFLLIRELRELILWFLFALFLSFAMEPGVNALSRRGWRRGAATALIVLGALVAVVLFIALIVPVVVEQTEDLVDRAPEWLAEADAYAERWAGVNLRGDNVLGLINDAKADVAGAAGQVAQAGALVLGALVQILTVAVFTFYLVADGPRFRRTICSVLPQQRQREILSTWEIAIDKTSGYVRSRLLLAGVSAAVSFVALTIIGVRSPLLLALGMGFISQFIPVIGTYLGASVPLLVALLDDPRSALFLLIFIVVYQQVENYILSPRITARTMQLHPALAFAAALVGARLGGLVGALIALPAVAVLQATISTYARRHEILETELTSDVPDGRHGGGDERGGPSAGHHDADFPRSIRDGSDAARGGESHAGGAGYEKGP